MTVSTATISTEHFAFMAIGRDPEHARDLIMQAWQVHVDAYGARRDLIWRDEINVTTGRVGEVFRDGGRIVDANDTAKDETHG